MSSFSVSCISKIPNFCFYAQPRAEEVCRRSGARGARRVGEKDVPLLDYRFHKNGLIIRTDLMSLSGISSTSLIKYFRTVLFSMISLMQKSYFKGIIFIINAPLVSFNWFSFDFPCFLEYSFCLSLGKSVLENDKMLNFCHNVSIITEKNFWRRILK